MQWRTLCKRIDSSKLFAIDLFQHWVHDRVNIVCPGPMSLRLKDQEDEVNLVRRVPLAWLCTLLPVP